MDRPNGTRFAPSRVRVDRPMKDHCSGSDIELIVDAMGYGRTAVARADGKVYFLEGGAPGDRVRATITSDHGSYAEAVIEQILEPGPQRVSAPCPLVGRCGGCPWQHLDYPAQLDAKRRSVIDALERIGGLANPPVGEIQASPRQFGYRNRLKLRFDGSRLGFYSARTHEVVPIEDCLIADDRIRDTLALVQNFVVGLATRVLRVEVASRDELPGIVLAINAQGRLHRSDDRKVRRFLEAPDASATGVIMWGKGWSNTWGDTSRRHAITGDGFAIDAVDRAFGQVNSDANRILVRTVAARACLDGSQSVLDLYAGVGNLSIPLAAKARRVVAVESDLAAVEAGRGSLEIHAISGMEFRAERVETYLAGGHGYEPDLVVMNPPRSGLGPIATTIAALRAPHLLYVSCNPATLARDFKVMAAAGYKLRSVTPIDMFPHTFHVESVCDAELT